MGKKLLFVYNPRAGKAQIKAKLADILDIFAAGEYDITIFPTRKHDDARQIVRKRAKDYELIVCSGGDGTLDEVVTGMMQNGSRVPNGYIPAGSTNDFGGSLLLPKNMIRAAEVIVNGRDFACDVGSFNEDLFVYIAAFGLFTDVSYETKQDVKNVLGHMADLLKDRCILGMVTNSLSVGGFKNITGKNVKLDDGVFEVTLIKRPRNPVELSSIMVSLLNRNIDSSYMYCFRTAHLTLESKEPVTWTLDGENGGAHTKVEIKNICKGIDIRVKS